MRPRDYRWAADGIQAGFARAAHWQAIASPKVLCAGFLLTALFYAFDVQADTTDCSTDNGTVAYAQCVNSVLTELQKQLDQTYRQALEHIPNGSVVDNSTGRKTRPQLTQNLVQAQSAWQIYASESCEYIGGTQGSRIWITIFAAECLIRETRSRIDVLQHLPGPP